MQWTYCNCCSFSQLKAFSLHSKLKFNTLNHYSETTLSNFQEWDQKQVMILKPVPVSHAW